MSPAPPRGRWRVVAVTYELDGPQWMPVVRHEFYGATPDEAVQVLGAHMRADAFLRRCTEAGSYIDVTCKTEVSDPEIIR